MASTTNVYADKFAYLKQESAGSHFTPDSSSWYSVKSSASEQHLLALGFGQISSTLKHKKLISSKLRTYANVTISSSGSGDYFDIYVRYYRSAANIDSLTYNTRPTTGNGTYYDSQFSGSSFSGAKEIWIAEDSVNRGELPPYVTMSILNNGGELYATQGRTVTDVGLKTVLSNGSTRPYLQITYDESIDVTSTILLKSGPISGYVNPRNDIWATWDYGKAQEFTNAYCAVETWEQTSAVFYWKTSTDESYQSIPITGATKRITVPANTFPTASTIQWYVSGTDEDNTTTQTPVYSFSTAAGTVYAQLIEPSRSVEDGSAPITLNWTIGSTDGQQASRTVLQWKTESGSTWTTLADSPTQLTRFTVPGGTFPAGTIEWRVTPYNIDGIAGTTGTTSFVCVAAPDPVQGLAATEVPFTTISWQSTGQEAYQIAIDGNVVAKSYGPTVYSYSLEEPLPDGNHTIAVTIQGVYGLWSQPSVITVSIQNVPTETITLSADFDVDAFLTWDYAQDITYIYRDGKRIGATNRQEFTDRVSLGHHDYYVLSPLPDGNYNMSDEISGTTSVECSYIALLSGGDWLELEHCKQLPIQTYTRSRTVSVRHYCGAAYPVAEVSTFYDKSGNFNVLFEDGDDELVERLESLMGEIVVMKNRRNNLLVGIFSQIDKRVEDYCVECDFIVQQTEWNDFADETNN